ncbi:hypothetical protein, partial [Kitasatospora purpeofusca]|uniref:hypothetical protein n=1 Tax=Kitasatospora purpeofusca TaxID=67352 RepID=UPI0035DB1CBE
WEIFIEQNFGPHMEQKWAVFAGSAGRVSENDDEQHSGERPPERTPRNFGFRLPPAATSEYRPANNGQV